MPHRGAEHTGARIARVRKVRRLTQRELADIAPVSYSTITKVEQGTIPASAAVIGALARALSVPVSDLTGQPYLHDLERDQLDGLIQPIREALDVYDLGADPLISPRPLDVLHAHADSLCAEIRDTNLRRAATELPGLIQEVTTAAHLAGEDRAWEVLASTYRTAYDVATKLGYADLCTVALDRMDWAATRASSPILAGMRQYMRALLYLRSGQYRTGQRLIEVALTTLQHAPPGLARDATTGQLHLGASMLYANAQRADDAEGHLREAEQIAARTGAVERLNWLAFGPANVNAHRVAALAGLNRYDEAVQVAERMTIPEDWPRSRASRHHVEVARAKLLTGNATSAFESLVAARKAGPQQTKYCWVARETYLGLEASRRQLPGTLAHYRAWLGM